MMIVEFGWDGWILREGVGVGEAYVLKVGLSFWLARVCWLSIEFSIRAVHRSPTLSGFYIFQGIIKMTFLR
jgi:hypothetical protein